MPGQQQVLPLFPYTTLFRSKHADENAQHGQPLRRGLPKPELIENAEKSFNGPPPSLVQFARLGMWRGSLDRKSTRLNSSHSQISYAVFCLKKKKKSPR